jgi:hypothetical protein
MQWMNQPLGTHRGNSPPVIIRSAEAAGGAPSEGSPRDALGSWLVQNAQRVALLVLSRPWATTLLLGTRRVSTTHSSTARRRWIGRSVQTE